MFFFHLISFFCLVSSAAACSVGPRLRSVAREGLQSDRGVVTRQQSPCLTFTYQSVTSSLIDDITRVSIFISLPVVPASASLSEYTCLHRLSPAIRLSLDLSSLLSTTPTPLPHRAAHAPPPPQLGPCHSFPFSGLAALHASPFGAVPRPVSGPSTCTQRPLPGGYRWLIPPNFSPQSPSPRNCQCQCAHSGGGVAPHPLHSLLIDIFTVCVFFPRPTQRVHFLFFASSKARFFIHLLSLGFAPSFSLGSLSRAPVLRDRIQSFFILHPAFLSSSFIYHSLHTTSMPSAPRLEAPS